MQRLSEHANVQNYMSSVFFGLPIFNSTSVTYLICDTESNCVEVRMNVYLICAYVAHHHHVSLAVFAAKQQPLKTYNSGKHLLKFSQVFNQVLILCKIINDYRFSSTLRKRKYGIVLL